MRAEEYRMISAVAGIQAEKAEKGVIPRYATLPEACARAGGTAYAECLETARRVEEAGLLTIRRGIRTELLGLAEPEERQEFRKEMLKGQVIGNIGADAEPRTVGGRDYWLVQVAHRRRKDAPTEWIRVMVRRNGDALGTLLRKGAALYASGELRCTCYSRRDGTPETEVTIWADDVQVVRPAQRQAAGDDLP